MSAQPETKERSLVMDKARVRALLNGINQRLGIIIDPTATALQAQQQQLASGTRPEDNELSCEIIRERERHMPVEKEG